jgi:hypothetical protein
MESYLKLSICSTHGKIGGGMAAPSKSAAGQVWNKKQPKNIFIMYSLSIYIEIAGCHGVNQFLLKI